MDFLNVGWSEILLILVLAFIVLGPNRITSLGHDLGTWVRKMNKSGAFREVVQTTDQIRNYPRKIIDEALLDQQLHDYETAPPIERRIQPPEEEANENSQESSGDLP